MNISKYQKLFGVGPVNLLISALLLGLLWLLDGLLGYIEILTRPRPIRIFGLVLIAIWICWHIWCIATIRHWWQHDRLCTTGPYRFVRHPMYAGGVLIGIPGISLLFNSWVVLLAPVLAFPVFSLLVKKEEAMMTAVFGEDYRRYAARSGRLFPRFFR